MNTNDSKIKIKNSKFLGLSIIFIIVLFTHCPVVKYNNPTDGAGVLAMQLLDTLVTNFSGATNIDSPLKAVVSGNPSAISEGKSASVQLKMSKAVTSPITVTITSDNAAITIDGTSTKDLAFTPENATTNQTITLAAVVDANKVSETVNIKLSAIGLEDQTLTITTLETMGAPTISVSNTPSTISDANSVVFGIKLTGAVTQNYSITISSDNAAIQVAGGTSTTLNFTPANNNVDQQVTLTAIHDANIINETVTITLTSADITTVSFTVTTNDTDTKALSMTGPSALGEFAAPGTANINLNYQPSDDVTVSISSSNASAITVSPATLTFTPSNWSVPQSVTLTSIIDANTVSESVNITFSSPSVPNAVLSVTHSEMTFTFGNTTTVTEGRTTPLSTVLSYAPQSDFTVNINSSNTSSISVSPATLTFTNSNWNTPQNITLTGVVDAANSTSEIVTISVSQVNSPASNKSITARDRDPVKVTSISSGNNSAMEPRAIIDTTNNKLLIVARNYINLDRLYLYRCNLDSTGCTSYDISTKAGLSPVNATGFYPSIALDNTNGKILMTAFENNGNNRINAFSCDLNLVSCSYFSTFGAVGSITGAPLSSIAVNPLGTKVAIVFSQINGPTWILETNPTFSSNTAPSTDLNNSFFNVANFKANGELVIGVGGFNSNPSNIRIYGTSNFSTPVGGYSISPSSISYINFAFDPVGNPFSVSCNGNQCSGGTGTIPIIAPTYTIGFPTIVFDEIAGKLIITGNGRNETGSPSFIIRCDSNYLNCVSKNLDTSINSNTSTSFAAMVFDRLNYKIIVAVPDNSGVLTTLTIIPDF